MVNCSKIQKGLCGNEENSLYFRNINGIFANHFPLPFIKLMHPLVHPSSVHSWELPNPGIKLGFPALQADSLPGELPRKTLSSLMKIHSEKKKIYRIHLYVLLVLCFPPPSKNVA